MAQRNPQYYYYIDEHFQLELNLQAVRRALIYLLDEAEENECLTCNRLRCLCQESSAKSSTLSDTGFSFSDTSSYSSAIEDYYFITAPPADALPMPVWQVSKSHRSSPDLEEYYWDIEKWLRASTPIAGKSPNFQMNDAINNEVNRSWPPTPKSIWCQEAPRIGQETLDPVEAFFRCFAEVSSQRGYSYF